jgi:hypothetical protein
MNDECTMHMITLLTSAAGNQREFDVSEHVKTVVLRKSKEFYYLVSNADSNLAAHN